MQMVGVVTLPEDILEKIKKNIRPQWKVCFWSALVVGLITHIYKLTNWLPNWDSLVFRYDGQNMVALGRWFLPIVSAPSSFYDLPWVTGLMAILFHGLGAVCICKMFGVRKNITAGLIGAGVVSFPTVTSVLMYNYVADAYALSFLLACVAALLMTKEKPRYVAAVVLIALSVGIYQAYITVTIMLLLCYLIAEAMQQDTKTKTLLAQIGKFLLTGGAGMALYYLVLTAVLKVTGTELLEYQGMDSATSLSSLDLLGSLYTIKESFVNYFFDFSKGIRVFPVLNVLIFALIAIFCLTDLIRNKLRFSNLLVLGVCVIALPFGASILAFVNSTVDYHNLMKMGFFIFYLFLILQYEKREWKKPEWNRVKSWVILAVTAVLIFNHILIANISYHKLNMAYEKSYGVLIRIADRIEQTEGAESCDRILVLGKLAGSEAYSADLPPVMTGTTDGFIIRADDEIVGQSVLCSALNDYCHKDYRFLVGEEKAALLEKIDGDSLDTWPGKRSVSVVDNVIIIKLSD